MIIFHRIVWYPSNHDFFYLFLKLYYVIVTENVEKLSYYERNKEKLKKKKDYNMKKVKKKIEKDQNSIMKIIKKKDKNIKEIDIKTWVLIKKQWKEYRKQWYQKLDKENNKYLTNVLNRYFLLQVKQMIIQLF